MWFRSLTFLDFFFDCQTTTRNFNSKKSKISKSTLLTNITDKLIDPAMLALLASSTSSFVAPACVPSGLARGLDAPQMNFLKDLAAKTAPDRGGASTPRAAPAKKAPAGGRAFLSEFGGNTAVMNPTARITGKAKPLSPGSNYPGGGDKLQEQSYGFGNFIQRFQKAEGKSKYGVPIFLPSGNVNPAYLKAERDDMNAKKAKNVKNLRSQREKMQKAGTYYQSDYIKKKVGNVGSGKDYYSSGR